MDLYDLEGEIQVNLVSQVNHGPVSLPGLVIIM